MRRAGLHLHLAKRRRDGTHWQHNGCVLRRNVHEQLVEREVSAEPVLVARDASPTFFSVLGIVLVVTLIGLCFFVSP